MEGRWRVNEGRRSTICPRMPSQDPKINPECPISHEAGSRSRYWEEEMACEFGEPCRAYRLELCLQVELISDYYHIWTYVL